MQLFEIFIFAFDYLVKNLSFGIFPITLAGLVQDLVNFPTGGNWWRKGKEWEIRHFSKRSRV